MSNTKRVGIPINSIEKYIGLMQNYDIPYVIVDNGKIVYKCSGKFDFVLKAPKFEAIVQVLTKLASIHFISDLASLKIDSVSGARLISILEINSGSFL